MKGIVFNLLEETVCATHGAHAWDSLVAAAQVSGTYSSLGSYPDEEVVALVEAASSALGASGADVLRWFGRTAVPRLAERFPNLFEAHQTAPAFVASVNAMIHPEVRKLYTGAQCPHFHFMELDDGRTAIAYRSNRRLCHFAHGLIEGAADYYGDRVDIEHLSCMSDGASVCRMALDWQA